MKNVLSFFNIRNLLNKSSLVLDFVKNIIFHPDMIKEASKINSKTNNPVLDLVFIEKMIKNQLFDKKFEDLKEGNRSIYSSFKLPLCIILKPKLISNYLDAFTHRPLLRKINRRINTMVQRKKQVLYKGKTYTLDIPYKFQFDLKEDEHYYIELAISDSFREKYGNSIEIITPIIPIFSTYELSYITVRIHNDVIVKDLENVFDMYLSITRGIL